MPYFALFYDVVDDFIARRAAHRAEHLRLANDANARGDLVFAGALADPPDGALLVFNVSDAASVERFARADPYVTAGLVRQWRVRPWTVVVPPQPPPS
jgi:uncharacterized protein YciI